MKERVRGVTILEDEGGGGTVFAMGPNGHIAYFKLGSKSHRIEYIIEEGKTMKDETGQLYFDFMKDYV